MPYADIDLGRGFGVPLHHCHLSPKSKNSSANMFTFKAPQRYDVQMPYSYVEEAQPDPVPDPIAPPTSGTDVTLRITPFINNAYDYTQAFVATTRIVYGKGFYKVRSNQRTQQTFSGHVETYDSNLTNGLGTLDIRGLSKEKGKAFEYFIEHTLIFNKNKFILEVFE